MAKSSPKTFFGTIIAVLAIFGIGGALMERFNATRPIDDPQGVMDFDTPPRELAQAPRGEATPKSLESDSPRAQVPMSDSGADNPPAAYGGPQGGVAPEAGSSGEGAPRVDDPANEARNRLEAELAEAQAAADRLAELAEKGDVTSPEALEAARQKSDELKQAAETLAQMAAGKQPDEAKTAPDATQTPSRLAELIESGAPQAPSGAADAPLSNIEKDLMRAPDGEPKSLAEASGVIEGAPGPDRSPEAAPLPKVDPKSEVAASGEGETDGSGLGAVGEKITGLFDRLKKSAGELFGHDAAPDETAKPAEREQQVVELPRSMAAPEELPAKSEKTQLPKADIDAAGQDLKKPELAQAEEARAAAEPQAKTLPVAPASSSDEPDSNAKPAVLSFSDMRYEAKEGDKGTVIISGKSAVEADLRFKIDGKELGETRADKAGNWTLIAPMFLKPGAHWLVAEHVDDKGKLVIKAESPFDRAEPPLELAAATPDKEKPVEQAPVQAAPKSQAGVEAEASKPSEASATPSDGDEKKSAEPAAEPADLPGQNAAAKEEPTEPQAPGEKVDEQATEEASAADRKADEPADQQSPAREAVKGKGADGAGDGDEPAVNADASAATADDDQGSEAAAKPGDETPAGEQPSETVTADAGKKTGEDAGQPAETGDEAGLRRNAKKIWNRFAGIFTADGSGDPGDPADEGGENKVAAAPSVGEGGETAGGDTRQGAGLTRPANRFAFDSVKYQKDTRGEALELNGFARPGRRIRLFKGDEQIGEVFSDNMGAWTFTKRGDVKPGPHLFRAGRVVRNDRIDAEVRMQYDHIVVASNEPQRPLQGKGARGAEAQGGKLAERASGRQDAEEEKTAALEKSVKRKPKAGPGRKVVAAKPRSKYFARKSRNSKYIRKLKRKRLYPKSRRTPAKVRVRYGTTLWGYSKHYYGVGRKYPIIVRANRKRLKNADRLLAGQKLYIPKLKKSRKKARKKLGKKKRASKRGNRRR